MYTSYFLFYAISALIVRLPRVTAQVSSAFSCYTVPDLGPSPKSDFSTYFEATTNTIFSTKLDTLTTTVTGQVPDSTVTVHKKAYETQWHDEYIVCAYTGVEHLCGRAALNEYFSGYIQLRTLDYQNRILRSTNYYYHPS